MKATLRLWAAISIVTLWAGPGMATPTVTPTETVKVRVTLNRNRINPLDQEKVAILGLQPKYEQTTITIYNQEGYLVRSLWSRRVPLPQEEAVWDGKNNSGQVVSSGVYVVVINGKTLKKRLRIAVIK
jgi:flagellar hook assembly protein FlgD